MERSLIKQVNRKNMSARLNSRKVKPVFYPNFFDVKQKMSLKWETLTGEKGAPVIADVISYDASAPQKTREVVGKMSGDIPKTAVKRGMNESDWNEYRQLSRDCNGDADLQALLDLSFKDQDFVYNAVRARFEWWCMQLMSKGGFALNKSNNNGIVTEEFVGCGMPKANRKVAAKDWANASTADGLQDIEDVIVAAAADGVSLRYVIMRSDEFSLLKKQKSTMEKVKGWINQKDKLTITKKVINEYLAAQEKPVTIVVIDPSVRIEDESHKRTTVNPWESRRVCFLEDLNVGDIQHGPIAAESSVEYAKKATTLKKDFIFISKWSELEPFKEWTKAEANAIPVINDPDAMYILKADALAWEESENTEYTDTDDENGY
ncbi:major capsid protein E [Bacteroides zoogleoformans]|uniref:Major capsid protein E n=1 Tax=Bacteroides zoogleoformans TaxID=28119 RepID=A0ABN5IKI5_9BACE|nr:major capsid protein [Bacteroides zoogleoformans]AVM53307.1 major capsid protein E [Bacteroides zoogleoformans]TWJ14407.1 major capsid protein E [Bacteroides zoogleoformans]